MLLTIMIYFHGNLLGMNRYNCRDGWVPAEKLKVKDSIGNFKNHTQSVESTVKGVSHVSTTVIGLMD